MNIRLATLVVAVTLPFSAAAFAAAPFSVVDKTGPDIAARHITGKELSETVRKGMTPEAAYSQVLLSKHDTYQVHMTGRDKNGLAEIHSEWNDHIFIQEGEASFVIGGVALNTQDTAPGEKRGTAIKGGATMTLLPGDYVFIPAGTPHQMIVKPGQRVTFIGFRTHK
jgi:mannose-6-phosphate isomerase-like protein (cupin superfamily)